MVAAANQRNTDAVALEEKVAFLRDPVVYPEAPRTVSTVETHMAWVFLTDRHVYKLKKPVAFHELDFTSLERRHWACLEEVRLNRRLAGDVYQGVVPLQLGPRGRLRLGDGGEIIDWMVQMKRLPADRMLDTMIEAGTWNAADVRQAAYKLANFYAAAPAAPIAPETYVRRFHNQTTVAAHALAASRYRISRDQVRATLQTQTSFLRRTSPLLEWRAREGFIVEGHGDLRPEHLCLLDEPVIFDCLEFSRELRLVDPADELGFLAMECERLGAPEVGALTLAVYADVTGDTFPDELVHFYQSCRAMQRARLAVRHTRRPQTSEEAKWSHLAEAYLQLAVRHAEAL